MTRPRRRLTFGCFLILLILCLVSVATGWIINQVPRWAAHSFGAPGSTLDLLNRYVYSARLLLAHDDLTLPLDPRAEPRRFVVGSGESAQHVAWRLEQEGFVRNGEAVRDFMVYASLDTAIQAGEYELSPAENAMEISRALLDATPAEITFNILAGWRLEEIAAALPTSGLRITPEEFIRAVRNPPPAWLPLGWQSEVASLEGYLFPGQYRLRREASLQEVVSSFIRGFDQAVNDDLRRAFEQHGLSLHQAVTLASIVQREGVVAEERPMIASVFLNRLEIEMKLDADPTVQYALGYNAEQKSWWTNPLSRSDLQYESPYNTYLNPGLPPGPICNPSLNALQAVAYPAESPYYFFRARCDGSGLHAFARTYEEHLQNACP